MASWLRQSTAVNIALGPFLDSSDVSVEAGLTIARADTKLKKNATDWAQKTETTSAAYEENGWYEVLLDATDTNTLGLLMVAVTMAGALPVWREFVVLPATVYDSLVLGTDYLQVDVQQWIGAAKTLAALVDDIWDEATSGHVASGSTGKRLIDAASAGDPWDSDPASYTTNDTMGKAIARVTAGSGMTATTVNVVDNDLAVVEGARVDVFSSATVNEDTFVTSGTTNAAGNVVFYLPTGVSYYLYRYLRGYHWDDPVVLAL